MHSLSIYDGLETKPSHCVMFLSEFMSISCACSFHIMKYNRRIGIDEMKCATTMTNIE
jgi:hypothetical protein